MKKTAPSPQMMEVFLLMKFRFIVVVTLAFILWEVQDFAASFAAEEMTTVTTLRTTLERDDARVQRAFAQARAALRVPAALETEPNPKQETRDARLTVTAKTKRETLDGRQAMVSAMQAAFAREGPGELFDIGNAPYAKPVQGRAYLLVKHIFQGGALAVVLAGLAMMVVKWKHSGLPRVALLGILASAFTLILVGLGSEGAGIWAVLMWAGPPVALLVLVSVVTQRVRRAAAWVETRARITKSKVEVERHRFSGDTTKVRNLPCVEYEFNPGTGNIQGDRISLGFGTADNVDEVLKRYPVGANVPVFYDPNNPQDCVLERNAPVSFGCLWGGAIFVVLVYEGVLLGFTNALPISTVLDNTFTKFHHPLLVLLTGSFGLFCLAAGIWNMLHPRKAFPWIKTKGTIVSSTTESYEQSDSSSGHRRRTYYRAVIEYSYQAAGQEYHGSTTDLSPITIHSRSQADADAEAARYPVGLELDVYYNPQKAAQSGLNVDTEMVLNGRSSLVVAAVMLAVAIYAAWH